METMCPAMNASSVDSCVNVSMNNASPRYKRIASAIAAGQTNSGELNFRSVSPLFFFSGAGCDGAGCVGFDCAGGFCGGSGVGWFGFSLILKLNCFHRLRFFVVVILRDQNVD